MLPGPLAQRSHELLQHEYDLLHRLDAANVARPLSLDVSGESLAMVVEDAGVQNLAEALRGRPLPVDRFVDLAVAMATVLGAVHRCNVIHRDICPENFILGGDGRSVVLIDFESATTVSSFVERGGVPAELTGTIAYMAPEQTGRMKRLVDARADLYSLGATFYEMLTGAPPFPASDPLETIHDHLARTPFPPAALNPTIPAALSAIVLRLLAKMPEHRYQTAEALIDDLEEARRQWRASGAITPFELGRKDAPYGLLREVRLYGRDDARARLRRAFERCASGARELCAITGGSGVGKSALLEELKREAGDRCHYLSGKCDLLRGNQPYAPFLEAFGDLVDALGDAPPETVESLRIRVGEAVAPNARVLTDAIPALERLLGAPPPAAQVGPLEAENRLRQTSIAFVRALAAGSMPVVLLIEDLQWADVASLKLLSSLATDPDLRTTLLVCTYRSEDVGLDHPASRVLAATREAGTEIVRIELMPLGAAALSGWLADVLHVGVVDARALADVLVRKTDGNPFSVRRLLGRLHHDGLLSYDCARGAWSWDLAEVAAAEAVDDVGALLASSLSKLSARDQRALEAAACIGNHFDLALLAAVCDWSQEEVAAALWAPLDEGLLVPSVKSLRHAPLAEAPVELRTAAAPSYRFAHDRIQRAAHDRLDARARQAMHLRVGRELLRAAGDLGADEYISEIVDQLDRGAGLLPIEEHRWLARLNQRAGRKAFAQSAHGAALGYFEKGLELLSAAPWLDEHALWFELARGAAEAASCVGEHERCASLLAEGLAHADTLVEKAAFYMVAVRTESMRPQTVQNAVKLGLEALRVLGVEVPLGDPGRAVQNEMAPFCMLLSESSPPAAPPARSDDGELDQARLDVLLSMLSPAWYVDVAVFTSLVAAGIRLDQRLGPGPQTAFVYACAANVLAMAEKYDQAFELATRAQALIKQFPNPTVEARVLLLVAGHVHPWRLPIAESIPLLRQGFRLSAEAGDLLFAAHNLADLVWVLQASGTDLNELLGEIDSVLTFYRRTAQTLDALGVLPARQAARCLKGVTRGSASFDDAGFVETKFLADASSNGLAIAYHALLRLQVAYLLGHVGDAQRFAQQCAESVPHFRSLFLQVDHHFYAALVTAATLNDAPSNRARAVEEIRAHLRRLSTWADCAPANFRHKYLLVSAELAHIEGRTADALTLFVEAIEAAGRSGFQHDEALAHERCGRLLLAKGTERTAAIHLEAARDLFERWGATAKVALLDGELSGLRVDRRRWPSPLAGAPDLDFLSLFKAAETLTGELVLDRLVPKLLRLCAEAACAQRTALVLADDAPIVRATLSATGEVALERTPLTASRALPVSVIERVLRSGERVLSGDATHEGPFATDPYVAEHGVRSLLAVPIRRAERPIGVLYFENNLATFAFVAERMRLLDVLSSQIAISLENSLLFEKQQRGEAEARFIAKASKTLAESLDYQGTLSRVARLAVPVLADWCLFDLFEGGRLRRIAGAHVDPVREPLLQALEGYAPIDAGAPQPAARALSTKRPFIAHYPEESLEAHVLNAQHAKLIRAAGARSVMAVPLLARGEAIGALTFVWARGDLRYGPREIELAEEIARRAAVAIENVRLYKQMLESVRVRDEFLTAASHELRTPVMSLLLSAQGLLRSTVAVPTQSRRVLELICRQASRLAKLVDDMMSVGRLHLDRLELHLAEMDLVALARDVMDRLAPAAAQAGCAVGLHAPGPVHGRWDPDRLDQVVTNLLANAIKFGAGKPIEILIDQAEGLARLDVIDHGIGIEPEALSHIFEKFGRATAAHSYGGLGLGLYIARHIVEAMGGTLRAMSTPGRETRFSVELPTEEHD
ncbi:Signal transduction histidine kinase CheA [Minicystis rosea]|nr:Signal transduction histidine kinase CheA [Minicystis rosea]